MQAFIGTWIVLLLGFIYILFFNLLQSPVLLPNGQEKRASDVPKPPSLFYSIIDMMAMAEGGIISASDPEYGPAVSNALYGILINERSRITYDKVLGLEIQDFEELAATDS